MVFNDVLRPIVDELNELIENKLNLPDFGNVNVKITNLAHDNLGANMLLGMVLSFSATYCCRFCEATTEETQTMYREVSSILRENVKEKLLKIQSKMDDKTKNFDHIETRGFKQLTELARLYNFKIERCSSVDLFHDFLEGIIPKDVQKVLYHLIFILKIPEVEIIDLINSFNFGSLDISHKPSNVKIRNPKLGLSGTQNKTLLENFPFIFGHLFTNAKERRHLNFINNLIELTYIAFKTTLTEDEIDRFADCAAQHLKTVKTFYKAKLSRKHHFLIHYPRMMRYLGPPIHTSSQAYESKHKFFTQQIRKSSVGKNVVKTLAIRHQSVQAVQMARGFKHELTYGKVTQLTSADCELWCQKYPQLSGTSTKKISWLKYGYSYSNFLFFWNNNQLYEILAILKDNQKIYLATKNYEFDMDTSNASCKIKTTSNEILIDFDTVKLTPTFNKIFCKGDKGFHVKFFKN